MFVPETKGKTIEEVQEFFSKDGNWDHHIFRIKNKLLILPVISYDSLLMSHSETISIMDIGQIYKWDLCKGFGHNR